MPHCCQTFACCCLRLPNFIMQPPPAYTAAPKGEGNRSEHRCSTHLAVNLWLTTWYLVECCIHLTITVKNHNLVAKYTIHWLLMIPGHLSAASELKLCLSPFEENAVLVFCHIFIMKDKSFGMFYKWQSGPELAHPLQTNWPDYLDYFALHELALHGQEIPPSVSFPVALTRIEGAMINAWYLVIIIKKYVPFGSGPIKSQGRISPTQCLSEDSWVTLMSDLRVFNDRAS